MGYELDSVKPEGQMLSFVLGLWFFHSGRNLSPGLGLQSHVVVPGLLSVIMWSNTGFHHHHQRTD